MMLFAPTPYSLFVRSIGVPISFCLYRCAEKPASRKCNFLFFMLPNYLFLLCFHFLPASLSVSWRVVPVLSRSPFFWAQLFPPMKWDAATTTTTIIRRARTTGTGLPRTGSFVGGAVCAVTADLGGKRPKLVCAETVPYFLSKKKDAPKSAMQRRHYSSFFTLFCKRLLFLLVSSNREHEHAFFAAAKVVGSGSGRGLYGRKVNFPILSARKMQSKNRAISPRNRLGQPSEKKPIGTLSSILFASD